MHITKYSAKLADVVRDKLDGYQITPDMVHSFKVRSPLGRYPICSLELCCSTPTSLGDINWNYHAHRHGTTRPKQQALVRRSILRTLVFSTYCIYVPKFQRSRYTDEIHLSVRVASLTLVFTRVHNHATCQYSVHDALKAGTNLHHHFRG